MAASTEGMKNELVNGTKTKQKASKNMIRRAKKKESRSRGEPSTREGSVVTVSEDESQQVGCHHMTSRVPTAHECSRLNRFKNRLHHPRSQTSSQSSMSTRTIQCMPNSRTFSIDSSLVKR